MTRARARIYSFGAAATEGAGGHREDMLRATAMDAARRGHHDRHGSAANNNQPAAVAAAAAMPGRREGGAERGSNEEKAGLAGPFVGAPGMEIPGAFCDVNGQSTNVCSNDEEGINADTDTSEQLGVIDISKVSSTRKASDTDKAGRNSSPRRCSCVLIVSTDRCGWYFTGRAPYPGLGLAPGSYTTTPAE